MERSGCGDLPTIRQLLHNNCGNLDAAVEDLLAMSAGGGENTVEPTPAFGKSKTHFSRKQLEKIRKQERKRASEARRKASSGNSSAIPDETIIIGKVQCLNI